MGWRISGRVQTCSQGDEPDEAHDAAHQRLISRRADDVPKAVLVIKNIRRRLRLLRFRPDSPDLSLQVCRLCTRNQSTTGSTVLRSACVLHQLSVPRHCHRHWQCPDCPHQALGTKRSLLLTVLHFLPCLLAVWPTLALPLPVAVPVPVWSSLDHGRLPSA